MTSGTPSAAAELTEGRHYWEVELVEDNNLNPVLGVCWSDADPIVARTQYADPTPDTRRQHTRDAIRTAEERELAAQRHVNEHYMHRQGRPMVLGV